MAECGSDCCSNFCVEGRKAIKRLFVTGELQAGLALLQLLTLPSFVGIKPPVGWKKQPF